MPAKPLRIGVIGANFGAAVHIPAFQSEGLEVVAVFSRNRSLLFSREETSYYFFLFCSCTA